MYKKICELDPGAFFHFDVLGGNAQTFFVYKTGKKKTAFYAEEKYTTGKGEMRWAENNTPVIPGKEK